MKIILNHFIIEIKDNHFVIKLYFFQLTIIKFGFVYMNMKFLRQKNKRILFNNTNYRKKKKK